MSLKDLFSNSKIKHLPATSLEELTSSNIESADFIKFSLEEEKRFTPYVDYSLEKNFARFGSAEKYYYDTINYIADTYPYDGSKKEKALWRLSSSNLDLYILENGYPKSTGYAVFSTSSLTATDTSQGYGAAGTASYEYVFVNGGPNPGAGNNVYLDPDTGEAKYRENANIWKLSKNRECNLKLDGQDGNTVEFWLKKAAFNTSATTKEVIFDCHTTSSISSSADYGRMRIELSGVASGSPWRVTYMSGTSGVSDLAVGANLTTASIADSEWHHYAFRFKNTGSNVLVDLFVDGVHNNRTQSGTTINYVSGTIVGTIGALATNPSGSATGAPQAAKGWGKLSGSLDEFRFWKVFRDSQQIQTRWFDQVAGGTNSDDSNTQLGIYYKFNEGITTTASVDSTVLDYSGRISNGTWVGYDSDYSRVTGSAINDSNSTAFSGSEFNDPIIYKNHPAFRSFLSSKRAAGKEYDYTNPSNIYYSLPAWIAEEHDSQNTDGDNISQNPLLNLVQIMSSYFDNAANMIKSVNDIKSVKYPSGSLKPIPFVDRLLESRGFYTTDIFNELDALEQLENRDNNSIYTEKFNNVKNLILQNIYNNLTYIYKSKGTEKSFRNLIRCFGVDDEIYKFNIYGNNAELTFRDNYRSIVERYKFIDFNKTEHTDASIYQYSSSLNSDSATFITGSNSANFEAAGLPFSVEANITFPFRSDESDYHTINSGDSVAKNNHPLILTASLFGMHSADGDDPSATTWATSDYANFVVQAVKDGTFSNKAYFRLTGTLGGNIPELTSSLFDDVYDDKNWQFLVSLYPTGYPNANEVSGTSGYTVEFSGIHSILDSVIQEFTVTGTMTQVNADNFLTTAKRTFVGAHRTNFTGSVLQNTDVKINDFKVWYNKISNDDLRLHARNPKNYGISNPEENAYLFNTTISNVYVPNKETLILHWDFTNVTASDSGGSFVVEDLTSGSASQIERYGWLSDIKNKQYLGVGIGFQTSNSDVVVIDEIVTAKPNLPETIVSEDMITVMTSENEFFTRQKRPTFFDLYIEKSPYQNISEEMMKFFSSIVDFNELIGRPVDRYRMDYKGLAVLRNLFFERIGGSPDIDKYVEYFKWFDSAISMLISQLAPASSRLSERPLRNIIESHVLERNKYWNKFPTYEFKQTEPEANVLGIKELSYNWKTGHGPISGNEDENSLWQRERIERSQISSGDAQVDSDRQTISNVINNLNNASPSFFSGSNGTYEGSTYALRKFSKLYKIGAAIKTYGSNDYQNQKIDIFDSLRKVPTPAGSFEGGLISISPSDTPSSDIETFDNYDDGLPREKRRQSFSAVIYEKGEQNSTVEKRYKGQLIAPFVLYSSSINNDASRGDLPDFQANLDITNIHKDTYGEFKDAPAQGPFTEKFVGGREYRHVFTNFSPNQTLDTFDTRLEGWQLEVSSTNIDIYNTDGPASKYYRDGTAKRPVNIKNLKQLTGALSAADRRIHPLSATVIGNFSADYEIVSTSGRDINNRYFVKSEGVLPTASVTSSIISGTYDFPVPRRDLTGSNKFVIVNKFSAPGDPLVLSEGAVDVYSGEYSPYNALPFRNLSVREPLRELLSDHANQFGYFSDAKTVADYELAGVAYPGGSGSVVAEDYSGTGSFHKINRNRRKQIFFSGSSTTSFVTKSLHDNFFVTHQIPRSDIQYSWITGTIRRDYTGVGLYGFEKPDFSNASLASTDLTFASGSDSGSQGDFVDFAGTNRLIVNEVLSGSNTLGTSSNDNPSFGNIQEHLRLNAILSHRGGPAGGSNWKLYRKDLHPVVRAHRNENRLTFQKSLSIKNNDKTNTTIQSASAIEPPITVKYKPLEHVLIVAEDNLNQVTQSVNVKHSYGNNLVFFSDHATDNVLLDDLILKSENTKGDQTHDNINYYLFSGELTDEENPIKKFKSLKIRETIFPKEKNTFLNCYRQREVYENGFWRDSRTVRDDRGVALAAQAEAAGSKKAFNPIFGVYDTLIFQTFTTSSITASIWSLDARLNFETADPARIRSGSKEGFYNGVIPANSASSDKAGILQNNTYPYNAVTFLSGGLFSGLPDLDYVAEAALVPQYNRRIAGKKLNDSTYEYIFGDTKWEAGDQSGLSPFYDKYSDYSEDIRRVGKSFSIVPEFRISEHMDYYLNQKGGDFLAENTASFSLTGSCLSSSAQADFFKTYSHSDFLKTFSIINDEYQDSAEARKITLSTEALIKFLPYDGFYPAERTVQLSKLFYESYKSSFTITGTLFDLSGDPFGVGEDLQDYQAGTIRPVWNSMFAPGILYNSIKSGIAVDYPIHTTASAPLSTLGSPATSNSLGYLTDIPRINTDFDYRVPFEALVDPSRLQGLQIIDNEPHPSASMNITASISSEGKPGYKLAMSNFLASTIDFFNPDGKLTTLASLPDNDPNFGNFELDKEYRMRVVLSHAKFRRFSQISNLFNVPSGASIGAIFGDIYGRPSYVYNPQTLVMYARTGSDDTIRSDYYGSSFGPPCRDNSLLTFSASNYPNYGSCSFAPYTPPYYDGYAHISYTYRPQSENPTINEVFQQLTASYFRYGTGLDFLVASFANENTMNLSASLNFKFAKVKNVTTDAFGNPKEVFEGSDIGTALTIQPKWETPVLDFKNVDVTLPQVGSGSVARGMWHQYGTIPSEDQGIFLELQDLDPTELQDPDLTGSLVDKLGFASNAKIGRIAKSKEVSEAIVAIPFYTDKAGNERRFVINRDVINQAVDYTKSTFKGGVDNPELTGINAPDECILDMVRKMRKFIIPPRYDFVTNESINPFAMFIFDFSVTLDQQDLANIWQNLPPDIGSSFVKRKTSLPVEIFAASEEKGTGLMSDRANPLFDKDSRFLPENTRWMVFKVKQRGSFNYFAKLDESVQDERYKFNFQIGSAGAEKESVPDYSYNYPYDFFSLIELAKIDADVELRPSTEDSKMLENTELQLDKTTSFAQKIPKGQNLTNQIAKKDLTNTTIASQDINTLGSTEEF